MYLWCTDSSIDCLLQLDTRFARGSNFVQYDFNKPTDIPEALWYSFDCVVIDPPFITADVWKKYTATVMKLLKPEGKLQPSSVALPISDVGFYVLPVCSLPGPLATILQELQEGGHASLVHDSKAFSRAACLKPSPHLTLALLVFTGKIILTSTQENAEMLHTLLAVTPQSFFPSVPHLVYQYALYCNYPSTFFSEPNPEIMTS